jgi:hypothetical protein
MQPRRPRCGREPWVAPEQDLLEILLPTNRGRWDRSAHVVANSVVLLAGLAVDDGCTKLGGWQQQRLLRGGVVDHQQSVRRSQEQQLVVVEPADELLSGGASVAASSLVGMARTEKNTSPPVSGGSTQ